MAKITRFKSPFGEMKTDPRQAITSSSQKDFLAIFHHYIQSELTSIDGFKLLNLWHLKWNSTECRIDASTPESICAGNRWLKTNWDGALLDEQMFKRFFGVVSGSSDFRETLIKLQRIARDQLDEPHPLHLAANLSFMIQLMLAHIICQTPNSVIELNGVGVVRHTLSERGKNYLVLEPGKFKAPPKRHKKI